MLPHMNKLNRIYKRLKSKKQHKKRLMHIKITKIMSNHKCNMAIKIGNKINVNKNIKIDLQMPRGAGYTRKAIESD